MPVTRLDPDTALILIDLQKGVIALPTVHPADAIVENANALSEAFRRHHLPVILVHVTGTAPGRIQARYTINPSPDWAELAPALVRGPQDHSLSKQTWGAFTGTGLEALLHRLGATQIVIAGIATSIGVESTARFAHELGFNVTLATDAMTDRSLEAHENSIERIFPRLGETGTTLEIIGLLDSR